MLKVTRWFPDTCECVFDYEWDDEHPENTRSHSFKEAVKLCEHHEGLSNDKAYDEVLSENTRKNVAFAEAQKIKPGLALDEYTWSFDKTRKLRIGFLGKLTAGEKSELQVACHNKFGMGKVEVI